MIMAVNFKVPKRPKVNCVGCGKLFWPKKAVYRYCSRECSFANYKQPRGRTIHVPVYRVIQCAVCRIEVGGVSANRRCCMSTACKREYARILSRSHSEKTKQIRSIRCPECRVEFVNEYGNKRNKYCGDKCSTRHRRRIKNGVRRAIKRGVKWERIDPFKIFDRDGWKCQMCGRPCPFEKRGTCEPDAPETDHVKAMCFGGPHVERNIWTSCRSCNMRKARAERISI